MKKIMNNKIGRAVIMLPIIVMWALFIIVWLALSLGIMLIDYVKIIYMGIRGKAGAAAIVKMIASVTKYCFVNVHIQIAKTINNVNNFIKTGTV